MKIIPYLMFDGNAEEALAFYIQVFNAKPSEIMRYGDNPDERIPETYYNKVLHAEVAFGGELIYISDNFPDTITNHGDGITLNVTMDSEAQINQVFKSLSQGGTITQPLEKQFWGAIYGSLIDQYGYRWSLNYQLHA